MKISEVREELQDFLSETNKTRLPMWLVEALYSWCQAVFMGVNRFKYWDEDKQRNEANVTVETLRTLIEPYPEFKKFITWLDINL